MNKLILFLALLFIPFLASAQPVETINKDDYAKIQRMIDYNIEGNFEELKSMTANYDNNLKLYIYDENKKSGVPAFLGNLILGYGLGSLAQGDIAVGLINLVGQGVATYYLLTPSSTKLENTVSLIGFSILRISSLILPFSYADKKNDILKQALNMNFIKSASIGYNVNANRFGDVYPALTLIVEY